MSPNFKQPICDFKQNFFDICYCKFFDTVSLWYLISFFFSHFISFHTDGIVGLQLNKTVNNVYIHFHYDAFLLHENNPYHLSFFLLSSEKIKHYTTVYLHQPWNCGGAVGSV